MTDVKKEKKKMSSTLTGDQDTEVNRKYFKITMTRMLSLIEKINK